MKYRLNKQAIKNRYGSLIAFSKVYFPREKGADVRIRQYCNRHTEEETLLKNRIPAKYWNLDDPKPSKKKEKKYTINPDNRYFFDMKLGKMLYQRVNPGVEMYEWYGFNSYKSMTRNKYPKMGSTWIRHYPKQTLNCLCNVPRKKTLKEELFGSTTERR